MALNFSVLTYLLILRREGVTVL